MEQAKERFKADLVLLIKAVATLEKAIAKAKETNDDIPRDAVIQRFEYTFELSWKTMLAASRYLGTEVKNPREAIRTAFKLGWVQNTDDWFDALDARNQTSHTYHEEVAKEVFETAKKFPAQVRELLNALNKI